MVVPKKNGETRVCVDINVTVNKVSERIEKPAPDGIFNNLHGTDTYVKPHLKQVY